MPSLLAGLVLALLLVLAGGGLALLGVLLGAKSVFRTRTASLGDLSFLGLRREQAGSAGGPASYVPGLEPVFTDEDLEENPSERSERLRGQVSPLAAIRRKVEGQA
jgi:hypothetical protein